MKSLVSCFVAAIFAVGVSAQGQQNDSIINHNVTVERQYVPELRDAERLSAAPAVVEPKKTEINAKYSELSNPLSVGGALHPLSAATLRYAHPADRLPGYARLAIGTYPNTLADFAYPLVAQNDLRIDVQAHHNGAYNAYFNTVNTAKISFDKDFAAFSLFGGIHGGFQSVKYYGKEFASDNSVTNLSDTSRYNPQALCTETEFTAIGRGEKTLSVSDLVAQRRGYGYFWRAGANLGIRSAQNADNLQYGANFDFDLFHNPAGITERSYHTSGNISFALNDNRLGAVIDFYNGAYSAKDSLNYYNNYAILRLNPFFDWNINEKLRMHLGLALTAPLAGEKGLKLNPDVRMDFKVLPEYIDIYAGISGRYKVNTMNALFYENPYLAHDVRAVNTHSPFEALAGVVVTPVRGLLFDVFIDYSYTKNQYYFVNKAYQTGTDTVYINRFDVVYDKSFLWLGGVRMSYTLKNVFSAEIKGIFTKGRGETEAFPWQKPFYDLSFNTAWRATHDLTFSLTGFYQAGIYARIGSVSDNNFGADVTGVKMDNRFDLNLGAAYTFRDWITLFVRANNLLAQQYESFYGYRVQGFNLMMGVTLSF